jgi:ribonuclease BN (tRNA processing enzyme)
MEQGRMTIVARLEHVHGRSKPMRLTVLGGCGAWPEAGAACSGYLLEAAGFLLLVDPGYAMMPRLLSLVGAEDIDAVIVTHGHPDHCADLSPLLRARDLRETPAKSLPVYSLPGALDAVLSLDRPNMLRDAYALIEFEAGDTLKVGPFTVDSALLPHWVPNAGVRITARDATLVYTGDSGPSREVVSLAQGADLFLAESTYVDEVPPSSVQYLSSARSSAQCATEARVGRLVLTHLWPGTDPAAALDAARAFQGQTDVARWGLIADI